MAKPKVRANGEGSIYQTTVRGKVVWRAAYSLPYVVEVDGAQQKAWKRICATSPSKTEAIARREALREKWEHGALPVYRASAHPSQTRERPQSLTVAAVLAGWLAWKTSDPGGLDAVGPNVARMYRRSIDLHINPAIGAKRADEVTRQMLSAFLTQTLPAKRKPDGSPLLGASPKRQIRNILAMAFRWAVQEEYLAENPAERLPRIAKPKVKGEQLERKKWMVQRILSKIAGTDEEAYWVLAFYGLRQSERLGLTWDCFSNLNGRDKKRPARMEIKQQLWRHPDTGVLSVKPDTKTDSGTRIIPLDERVRRILWAHKLRQDADRALPGWRVIAGMEHLVFSDHGRPVLQQTDNRRWRALFDRCVNPNHAPGSEKYVTPLRGHALRHIAISMMVGSGAPIEVVRVLAGHSDDSITRAVYTHLSWREGREPIEGLTRTLYDEADKAASRRARAS